MLWRKLLLALLCIFRISQIMMYLVYLVCQLLFDMATSLFSVSCLRFWTYWETELLGPLAGIQWTGYDIAISLVSLIALNITGGYTFVAADTGKEHWVYYHPMTGIASEFLLCPLSFCKQSALNLSMASDLADDYYRYYRFPYRSTAVSKKVFSTTAVRDLTSIAVYLSPV